MPSLKPENSIRQHKSMAENKGIWPESETFGVQALHDHDRPAGPDFKEGRTRHMHDGKRAIPGPKKPFHSEPRHHDGDWNEY
jgi:hypothetical protein